MKIEDLIEGNDYLWATNSGESQVVTFSYSVKDEKGFVGEWPFKFTNGVELSERVVNFAVSEVQVWPPVPHIHAKEMIAFAKGHEVEVYAEYDDNWHVVHSPFWNLTDKYRVKKDNSGQIALLEKVVADLNKEIETRQFRKQGWLKRLQELQS